MEPVKKNSVIVENMNSNYFIVLSVEAWSDGSKFSTEYRWNKKRYPNESIARETETRLRGHDDFAVAEVSGDKLLAVCTMTDGKRINKKELEKISVHIGLRY
jgi:hypothetical protein